MRENKGKHGNLIVWHGLECTEVLELSCRTQSRQTQQIPLKNLNTVRLANILKKIKRYFKPSLLSFYFATIINGMHYANDGKN
jgi:hypothetical protein